MVDSTAIGLSSLCLVHCLGLPIAAAFLPLAGAWAEAEWIHQLFVLITIPITLFALRRHRVASVHLSFVIPALIGLSFLFAAGFIETVRDYETPLTVLGAILLGSAHIWRWIKRYAPTP